ncbi:hypothetical protein GA0115233_112710 [Streptomyces sp. DI166]|uniref:hypothetical protein n=1 Tax=Streptomyces sp. DI166 TaxID=1839783 RepID=UPI0007F410BB|nr:hypothetical protein [Streptomyces sp. DI166]SBT95290.1 hypothetical protein GA0115233_112710 [Streptomyces sp. DI166]
MSFGGPYNPYPPPPPNGGPYPPPPPPHPPHGGPYPPPPYIPPQPNPYGPGYPPQPHPYGPPYPPPQPAPTTLFGALGRLREAEWPPLRVLLRGGQPRIHGCTWAVIALPCTWFVTLPLMAAYVFARSARAQAHRFFPPRGHRRIEDPDIVRVQRVRAWTAVAMSVLLLVMYGTPEDVSQAQEQYMMRLAVTPPLLLLSAPLVTAFLFRMASPEAKARMRPRLRAAGRSALLYVGAVTGVPLFLVGSVFVESRVAPASGFPWMQLLCILPFFWLLFFVGFATGPAVRTGFNTAGVHAALPALLTAVLVWEFSVISLAAGGLPPGPPLVQILAVVAGPASVTAVVRWELHRLRTRYGVALRA